METRFSLPVRLGLFGCKNTRQKERKRESGITLDAKTAKGLIACIRHTKMS